MCLICRNVLLLWVLSSLVFDVYGDAQIRSLQEELRRRHIYFGEVDGRRTPELEAALRRYQQRKGFGADGWEDRDTLRSLGLVPRSTIEVPPTELEWPEEPILKSDINIDVLAIAERVADETGVSAQSVAPEIVAERSTARRKLSASATTRRRTVSSREQSAAVRAARHTLWRRPGDKDIAPEGLRAFIQKYLKAVSRNNLRDELAFYADRVDYYHNGIVDRRIIERTLRDYYRRWPKRHYSLGKAVDYAAVPSRGEIVVTFRVAFSLKNRRTRVKGATDNRFIINAATVDPRIVKIGERRVRS